LRIKTENLRTRSLTGSTAHIPPIYSLTNCGRRFYSGIAKGSGVQQRMDNAPLLKQTRWQKNISLDSSSRLDRIDRDGKAAGCLREGAAVVKPLAQPNAGKFRLMMDFAGLAIIQPGPSPPGQEVEM
jgi:hypothetical protein